MADTEPDVELQDDCPSCLAILRYLEEDEDFEPRRSACCTRCRDVYRLAEARDAVDLPSEWLRRNDSRILTLARAARESGYDPDYLLILSDALEDVGCTDRLVLDHLRDTTLPHDRGEGCWVIDRLLAQDHLQDPHHRARHPPAEPTTDEPTDLFAAIASRWTSSLTRPALKLLVLAIGLAACLVIGFDRWYFAESPSHQKAVQAYPLAWKSYRQQRVVFRDFETPIQNPTEQRVACAFFLASLTLVSVLAGGILLRLATDADIRREVEHLLAPVEPTPARTVLILAGLALLFLSVIAALISSLTALYAFVVWLLSNALYLLVLVVAWGMITEIRRYGEE